jgi:Uma2 family endonuclease
METLIAENLKSYSIEEYLSLEDNSVGKNEFFNGKIIKMSGATPIHNLIAVNISTQLNIELEKKGSNFLVLNSDTRIHIPKFNYFLYPDAVVVCEEIQLYKDSSTVITNPLLIVEVLSPSTEEHDRTNKFSDYKQIPSFKEYVLIAQGLPWVLSSYKIGERTWEDTEAEGLDKSIYLQSIDCTIDLKKIYRGIKFEEKIK